jgi:hypothetical protein
MGAIDYVILAVIALVIGGAVFFMVKAKRSGKRCIGCPDSGKCSSAGGCTGDCACCSGPCGEQKKEEN